MGGRGRGSVVAGVITVVLLLSASSVSGGEKDTFHEKFNQAEGQGDGAGNPGPGFRMRLHPFIFLAAMGGAGDYRGLNFLCPMGGDTFRLHLKGSVGFRPGAGRVEAGSFLSFSYDF